MSSKASHSAKGHAKKHTHAAKHVSGKSAKHHPKSTKAAHHVTTQGKPQTVGRTLARARGLALDGVACCTAEALAASLQLQGLSVSDGAALDLFWRAGGDPEAGAPIVAVLEAASEGGLAGVRLTSYCPAGVESVAIGETKFQNFILGVDLPGPHTVLATPEGWWSWGELHDPAEWPDAVVEEAWAVTWQ